ncbi:putative DNA primase/helicase [Aquimarina sp. MAR_2010_214]|uniref:DNA primase family protein n=1 Tax=Aquimarina sp. MAR_2010_214 TaxID=1250026 RepID=UPI000C71067E|nr:phage/plasmid primase, P4 family [Aquimarina sp. MAR_2010_214]PKV50249.1 putative DNA primase/helicase [Aquimarina sp. MAR_2010_214]
MGGNKSTIEIDDILEETDKLLTVAHNQKENREHDQLPNIFNQLLRHIEEVDFRKYAELSNNEKPRKVHFLVSIIEILLEKAMSIGFHLCRKYDYVYVYNGEYWQLIAQEEFEDFLCEVALKTKMNRFHAKYFAFKGEMYKQFLSDARLKELRKNQKTILINLANGTFEISPLRRVLRPFDKNDFLTYQLPFSYNKEATAPQFQEYLDKVLPEQELQDVLSEYLGYIFIKNSVLKLEKVLLAYGSGANGKSVLFDIINALLGEENFTSYSLQSLTEDKGYYRSMLTNKLLNYASEINGKLETNTFKLLVSGEPVEARLPFGKPQLIKDYARFMFNCNELPENVENNNAFFRRFLILPFRVTIPISQQDPDLSKRIVQNELSGVFNWVLKGTNRLLENRKFTDSPIVRNEILRYQRESDTMTMFLDDTNYESNPAMDMPLTSLFNEYRGFCIESNYTFDSKKAFSKKMQKLGFKIQRKNYGMAIYAHKKSN